MWGKGMKILYGTTNPSKIKWMKKMLEGLDIELLTLNDVKLQLGTIDESGNKPLDNARIKALAYYKAAKIPVFSCDSGLYIEGLNEEEQPGVHVRRVHGKTLNDEEMIEYYSGISRRLGGKAIARYRNAICLVIDKNQILEYDGNKIASGKFIIAAKPHKDRDEGFPLNSLSVHIESGKYYMDIKTPIKEDENETNAYKEFFMKALKKTEGVW